MQRRSQEEILKKPRVPKVAEILPDVKIIKKKKSKATLEPNKDLNLKYPHSPAKGSKLEKDKEKSESPKPDKRFNSKLYKKPHSPKKKKLKGQVVIYNAAGIPVAVYDNQPSGRKLELGYPRHDFKMLSVEDRRSNFNSTDHTVKSDPAGKGNFRVINPTREEALLAMEHKNQFIS